MVVLSSAEDAIWIAEFSHVGLFLDRGDFSTVSFGKASFELTAE